MPMNCGQYDAVVIGSGFGGCFAAYRLARSGRKTLLLERGDYVKRDEKDWDGAEILVRQRYRGASPVYVKQYRDRSHRPLYPNDVVGGMSVFYGGASLRLREADLANWPIGYQDLAPYYEEAEGLLSVHGEAGEDPFEPRREGPYPFPSIELAPPAQRVSDAARALGHRPFRMPLAINFSDESRPLCVRCVTCDGFPCKVSAKNDLACTVLPRGQSHGLTVMAGAVVRELTRSEGRIVSAECVDARSGAAFEVSGDCFIIGAGAIGTPALLLRSGIDEVDRSDTIGRYLMRHCNAVIAGIFPFRTNPDRVFHKQICLTDFYEDLRGELGTAVGVVQDIYTPGAQVLRHFAPFGLKRAAAAASAFMQNLLCVAEDDPRLENTVTLSRETDSCDVPAARVTHAYSEADRRRRDHLVANARAVLRQAGAFATKVYEIDTFSHAVGSVRFGTDPTASALDPDCRLWGLENAYVVDGSFMPTSGGVNPSLTIAANALRVAEKIGLGEPNP